MTNTTDNATTGRCIACETTVRTSGRDIGTQTPKGWIHDDCTLRTYSLAVNYGDGLEAQLSWVCTATEALHFYDLNRREYPHPTALIDGTGRILVSA